MLTLSLVFAFLLDRLVPDLRKLRDRKPLDDYYHWLLARIPMKDAPPWAIPLLLILPLVLLFAFIQSLVDAALWDFFLFAFTTALVFLCIDSSLLFERVDESLEEESLASDPADKAAADLFDTANSAYYSVVFWLIVGGPVLLVFYRLVQKLPATQNLADSQRWSGYIATMLAWLEWPASLLTCASYMICGNFDAALKQLKAIPLFGDDMGMLNRQRLTGVGLAAINAPEIEDNAVELLKRSRGLALRTLVLWVLLAALLEVLF